MGALLNVKYVMSFRTVWASIIFSLFLIYQSVAPLSYDFWGGWSVLVGWLLLVALVVECICREFSKVAWKNVDEVDFILSVLVGLLVAILAATVAIDFIPENYTSKVYTTHNLLTAFQCDEVIRISELHAQKNINSLLGEYNGNASHPKVAAAVASGGWLTTRHANYPTTDISAYSIKQNMSSTAMEATGSGRTTDYIDFVQWLNQTVDTTILPILQKQFDIIHDPETPPLLTMQDLFIVKYDADNPYAQKHLEIHTDSSQLSFNIALSTHQEDTTGTADITATFTSNDGHLVGTKYAGGGTYFVRSQGNIFTPKGAMLSHPSRLYHAGSTLIKGKRYILVGFVKVHTNAWTTLYRRFGMFSRCVAMTTAAHAPGTDLYTISEELPVQCQSYLYVFFYELYVIVTDPFTKARTNSKSFWLSGLFTLIIICVLLSLVSVIMLLISPPDEDVTTVVMDNSEEVTGGMKVRDEGQETTDDTSTEDMKKFK